MLPQTEALARQALALHLEQAAQLRDLSSDGLGRPDPLLTARLAASGGDRHLARALIARSGGLLDTEESERLLTEPVPAELRTAAAEVLRSRPDLSGWTETQREMYVRVLAGLLVAEPQAAAALLQPSAAGGKAGLWRLPALPERQRWAAGQRLVARLGQVQWASASWGGRWGLRRELQDQAEVEALETVVAALSAVWNWELPALPALLSRPLLVEGLETLSADRLALVTSLLADAAALFGWTVIALPALDAPWPDEYQPLPLDWWAAPLSEPACQVEVTLSSAPLTLPELAARLSREGGRTLVVLYSRASAARLAGMLPQSLLLSTSLCRAHLDSRMSVLAEQAGAPDLTVIATTLPSTPAGKFDRVYHLMAPLPHLVEAAQLTHGPLLLFTLRDVALPPAWEQHSRLTAHVLEQGEELCSGAAYRQYSAQLRATERVGQLTRWQSLRRHQQYASLSSELQAQPSSAVPVLIAYDPEGEAAIVRSRERGWLARPDLRYAAWVTPMEAQRAIRLGQAEPFGSGWALVWRGPYDETYGLAWPLVQAEQQRSEE